MQQEGNFLQEIKLQFSKNVEIVKMIETVRKNWLQIYTLDHELQIISIITWDFEQNTEQSILQWRFDRSESEIGYHLVKGMNQKMNYFITEQYIIDLEYNVPTRQANVNQNIDTKEESYGKQLKSSKDYFNQRKVHFDG